MFFPEDNVRARWLEAVPSSPGSHALLHSPQQNLPLDFDAVSVLAEEDWAGSIGSPSRKASPFPDPGKRARPGKTSEGNCGVGEGRGLDSECQVLQTGWETQGQGQGSRKEPPRQEQTPKLRVGQETGLAPGVPALMSWKQEEMAQHVKASKGKGLPMPAGQERAERGGHRAQPLSTP